MKTTIKYSLLFAGILLFILSAATARAESYPWLDHESPFDFLFLNNIDTHQQTQLMSSGDLQGFFYITYTGNVIDGLPEARHGDETVGWILHGVPATARLISVTKGAHPVWCIDPADLPVQRGYTHFHWLDASETASGLIEGEIYDGYILKLTARDGFAFSHNGSFFVTPGIDFYTHDNIVISCE